MLTPILFLYAFPTTLNIPERRERE